MSAHATPVILPGATLGVLGGGQLGRMFAHAAQAMGYFTAVLDPDATSPAGRISHHHIRTRLQRRTRPGRAGPASAPPSPPNLKTCPLPA